MRRHQAASPTHLVFWRSPSVGRSEFPFTPTPIRLYDYTDNSPTRLISRGEIAWVRPAFPVITDSDLTRPPYPMRAPLGCADTACGRYGTYCGEVSPFPRRDWASPGDSERAEIRPLPSRVFYLKSRISKPRFRIIGNAARDRSEIGHSANRITARPRVSRIRRVIFRRLAVLLGRRA